jgi:diacylglycerol diphosphate phosphatase/phosphatidate phosphatase
VLASYFLDLLLIGLLYIPALILNTIQPFERIIWRDDRSIMYPYSLSEIVPSWALPLFAFVLPMIMITVWMGVKRFGNKRLFVVYVGLILALAITVLVTNIVKPLVGRARPDFLARCDADPLVTSKLVCRGSKALVAEGRRSFPSGHTSSSFAGLMFAAFFLAGQMSLFDGEGRAYRLVVSVIPFLLAVFVGISRVMDYRHHWQDVLAGAILGTVIAYLCYRMYFPAIMSDEPYEPLDRRLARLTADKDDEGRSVSIGPDSV